MSRKIIVSGATGQDGSYMIEYLLENTQNTIIAGIRRTSQAILSNLKDVINNPRLKLVTLDLCDVHSITNLIREEKPDYFINLGASTFVSDSWINPALHFQNNSLSLIHILEAVRNFAPNCRVYSAGSSEQWGDVKYSPQDEKHPMSPRSIYGISKCAASHICKVYRESFNLYVVHGILTNHESPRRQDYFISRKITQGVARINHALKNSLPFEPISCGNISAQRDWSHAKDFVDGIWRMLNQPIMQTTDGIEHPLGTLCGSIVHKLPDWKPKEYVLSSDKTYAVKYLIELAFSYANIEGTWVGKGVDEKYILPNYILQDNPNIKSSILVKIDSQFFRPADVELLCGNSTLARKELGWEPKYDFETLIKEMVSWDIENYGKQ